MLRKKLLALLLAAAMALSLLAACGNGESAVQVLLNLLDGKYPNISIEIDPDLEADLRQAIRTAEAENAGDDAAVIRAALETALGSTITFRYLGDGQKGDTAFDLIFYAGSDPDKAAQAAYSQWNPILSNVPADGQYGTALAMVETNSGVWMLVKATVEKAGSRDDGPDPVTLEQLSMTGPSTTEYKENETFNPAGMTVTAYYSDGSTKTIDIQNCTLTIGGTSAASYTFQTVGFNTITVKVEYQGTACDKTFSVWVADENGYHEEGGTYFVTGSDGLQNLFENPDINALSATIILEKDQTVTSSFGTFTGTLQSESASNRATIVLTSDEGKNRTQGLFNEIGTGGTVQDVDIQVTGNISNGDNVGAVAGTNHGTIQNCHVAGKGMIEGGSGGAVGGIAGYNYKIIQGCSASVQLQYGSWTGGVVGWNDGGGTVTACYHTDGTVSGDAAGGVVGYNYSGTVTACYSTSAVSTYSDYAGGVVGYNEDGTVTACYSTSAVSGGTAGGVVGENCGTVTNCYHAVGEVSGKYAGGVVGYNGTEEDGGIGIGTVTACYWSGSPNAGIGNGTDTTIQVTADGDNETVTWDQALGVLNGSSNTSDYRFDGTMNDPTLTKK